MGELVFVEVGWCCEIYMMFFDNGGGLFWG